MLRTFDEDLKRATELEIILALLIITFDSYQIIISMLYYPIRISLEKEFIMD